MLLLLTTMTTKLHAAGTFEQQEELVQVKNFSEVGNQMSLKKSKSFFSKGFVYRFCDRSWNLLAPVKSLTLHPMKS